MGRTRVMSKDGPIPWDARGRISGSGDRGVNKEGMRRGRCMG